MNVRVMHCARVLLFSYGKFTTNIATKIFSLIYLHFGKLQSNTFTERFPKIRSPRI